MAEADGLRKRAAASGAEEQAGSVRDGAGAGSSGAPADGKPLTQRLREASKKQHT